MSQPTKRLGELLLERRLITSSQLEQALLRQRSTSEFLGTILVRMDLLSQQALLEVLSEQFGMPHEPLSPECVDWKLVKQFPLSILSAGRCMPLRADAESVTVAIVNPLDVEILSAVEKAAGLRRVRPVLVLERELQAVSQVYRQRLLQSTIDSQFKTKDHRP